MAVPKRFSELFNYLFLLVAVVSPALPVYHSTNTHFAVPVRNNKVFNPLAKGFFSRRSFDSNNMCAYKNIPNRSLPLFSVLFSSFPTIESKINLISQWKWFFVPNTYSLSTSSIKKGEDAGLRKVLGVKAHFFNYCD